MFSSAFGGDGGRRLEEVPRFLTTPTNLETSFKQGMLSRSLQTPTDDDYVCAAPDIDDETLLAILQGASVECGEVTEEEFNEVFASLKKLFAAKSCWEKVLCDMNYIATLSYKIFFEYGAKCAGVDLDIPECVYDKVIELLVMLSATKPAPENPTEEELFYLVSTYLVTPAVEQCDAKDVNKDEATSDVVAILKSLQSPVCVTDTVTTKSSAMTNVATTTITTTPTTNTQSVLPPTTTTIHGEAFANIPTSPAATTTATRNLLPLISIAGGLVAIGAIIGGVYRSNKHKKKTSNCNNGGGDEKSIQSINSKSTDESEVSVSLADEENDNSQISSTTISSLASMAAMSTLVTNSGRVDRRASI
jgi:hypothetical protein